MEIIRINLKNNPNISIRCAHSTNLEDAKKVVFFLNGRSEWVEKFQTLIQFLDLPEDTAWVSWDHRGQGGSDGRPSHISNYKVFARDTAELVKHFAQGRPYAMVCHSMGSLIATVATLRNDINPTTLVLMSPLFGLPKQPLPHVIGRPLAKYATKFGFGRVNLGFDKHLNIPFKRNRLTHDPEKYKEILDYPFKWTGPTFGWIDATFRACDFIYDPENFKKSTAKTRFYVLGGTDERVVDPAAFKSWTELCKQHKSCELKIFEGARHELHMESKEYLAAAADYIKQHLEF